MSINRKVVLAIVAIFGIYGTAQWLAQTVLVLPRFLELESAEATRNVERALAALDREAALLLPSTRDWGTWDDTYNYVTEYNQDYFDANLNAEAMLALRVNYIGIYSHDGKPVWTMTVDQVGKEVASPVLTDQGAESRAMLLKPRLKDEYGLVLYRTPGAILLVTSSPILKSSGEGPSRGVVIMGRLIDATEWQRLASQTHIRSALRFPDQGGKAAPSRVTPMGIRFSAPNLKVIDATTHAVTSLFDTAGQTLAEIEVDTPRAIEAQGRLALRYASAFLVGSALLVLCVLIVLLRHMVLSPLSALTRHVAQLGQADRLDARLNLDRRDEIGTLAKEFDGMVAQLDETQKRLLDQSYFAGVAEMASGVLHNIGNAITPLTAKLARIGGELSAAPHRYLATAGQELAAAEIDAERRADLISFIELASAELADSLDQMSGDVASAAAQAEHVQAILADQQKFARADRQLEALDMVELVKRGIALLPEELLCHCTIEYRKGTDRAPLVLGSRIALQQVINNLLLNAVEAIAQRFGPAPGGQLCIDVETHEQDHSTQIDLCVRDNGVGFDGHIEQHMFERGFSTKQRGSGMGLHWSANAMAAMHGVVKARSDGPDSGAVFTVTLDASHASSPSLEAAA